VLNIQREKAHFIFAGRLSKRKGLDILLYYLNELVNKIDHLKLVIVGKNK